MEGLVLVRDRKTAFRFLTLAIVCSLALELLVYNYRSVESLLLSGGGADISTGDVVLSPDAPEVEFSGLDVDAGNMRLSLESDSACRILVYVKDEGNSEWFLMPSSIEVGAGSADCYTELHPAGNLHAIKLALPDDAKAEVSLEGLAFNMIWPFSISWKRLLVFFVVASLVFAFRPKSRIYEAPFSSCKKLIVVLVCLQVGAVLAMGVVSPYGRAVQRLANHEQYYDLAVSLSRGEVSLESEPSPQLLAMDNPYDFQAREEQDVPFYWDRAFHEGKYYVYFGMLPALLFHLPFYLVTGGSFPNWIGVLLCCAVFVAGLSKFLWEVCSRWFPSISFGVFALANIVLASGSWILYACYYQDLYCLPIALGLACLVWGLSFWIRATARAGELDVRKAIVGSSLVALTLLCRPQLFVGAALGIVLVAPYMVERDRKKRRSFLRGIALALLPFVIVFLLAGWYNAARFGSPLDFGANYNLTSNDMTQRGFVLDRIPLAVFHYIFQLPLVSPLFPFLCEEPIYVGVYMGNTIYSTMYGGILVLSPLLLWLFALPFAAGNLKDKGAFGFSFLSLLAAVVLVAFDAEAAGILPRYFCDFGFFFAIAAVAVFLACFETYRPNPSAALAKEEVDGGSAMVAGRGLSPAPSNTGLRLCAMWRMLLQASVAAALLSCVIMVLWIFVQPAGPT